MPNNYDVTTNFKDSNNTDLGNILITKDYLLDVYPQIAKNLNIDITPNVWIWGNNPNGQLGINVTGVNRSTPVTVFSGANTWIQVSCGAFHSGAIKNDGTLWMWGFNGYGGLGTNNTTTRSTPITTFAGGNNWSLIHCGRRSTAAIKSDGTLWTWGWNASGHLGVNDINDRATPVTTFAGGNDWKQVCIGNFHMAAIKTDGTLWTWGNNNTGKLGTNNTTTRSTPVTTFAGGNNWRFVTSGTECTFGIKTDGTLWCWGENSFAQLGDNTTTQRNTPVTTFAGGNTWITVSSKRDGVADTTNSQNGQTAAVKNDGTLWVWGTNAYGQLGINNNLGRTTPVTTFAGGTTWKSVCVMGQDMAALKTDGTLWVWGGNSTINVSLAANGFLGTNDNITRSTPVTTFLGGNNWRSLPTSALWHIGIIRSADFI